MAAQSIAALPRSRKLLTGLAVGLGLLALLWLVYLGLTWDLRAGAREPDAAFRPVAVERGDLPETVVATGVLEPSARVVVQSEIPGIVAAVHVDDGERVTRGQAMVELDRERLEDRVAELAAALEMRRARARYDLVGRARADLDEARRDLARARRLLERGVASKERIEDLAHEAQVAEIALSDARAEQAARRAAVLEAENALRRVERDLAKTMIRSPVDGVVVRRQVEVGTAVADLQNGGTVVATLADDRRIHVLAEVDENEVAGVRVGQPASVRIDAFPEEIFEGTVRKVSSSGTAEGGLASFEIEIELAPDERVRVGMSADARVEVGRHRGVLLVPNTALVRTEDGAEVRTVGRGGRPELVRVEQGYSDGFRTVVRGGLSEGDTVLVRSDGAAP
jgi:HlyD family secretion protein